MFANAGRKAGRKPAFLLYGQNRQPTLATT
jgi:hypothetical protein